jgi:predicted site-specific integrase-resolvase
MTRPTPVRHLNQSELADRWGISHRTLERWRWIGEGPPYLKIGGRVAYRIEDIERYERERLRLAASGAPAQTGSDARERVA